MGKGEGGCCFALCGAVRRIAAICCLVLSGLAVPCLVHCGPILSNPALSHVVSRNTTIRMTARATTVLTQKKLLCSRGGVLANIFRSWDKPLWNSGPCPGVDIQLKSTINKPSNRPSLPFLSLRLPRHSHLISLFSSPCTLANSRGVCGDRDMRACFKETVRFQKSGRACKHPHLPNHPRVRTQPLQAFGLSDLDSAAPMPCLASFGAGM